MVCVRVQCEASTVRDILVFASLLRRLFRMLGVSWSRFSVLLHSANGPLRGRAHLAYQALWPADLLENDQVDRACARA